MCIHGRPAWGLHGENDFGPVGISRGQTARINVVNLSEKEHHACPLILSFLDDAGRLLGHSTLAIVDAEQADRLDLSAGSLNLAVGERKEIRGHIKLEGKGYACRHVIATEEVFDNETGRTQVFNPMLIERCSP